MHTIKVRHITTKCYKELHKRTYYVWVKPPSHLWVKPPTCDLLSVTDNITEKI